MLYFDEPAGRVKIQTTSKNIRRYFSPEHLIRYIYYPTVLVIVQKVHETSTDIPRYCTVGSCTLLCARSSCYTCSLVAQNASSETQGQIVGARGRIGARRSLVRAKVYKTGRRAPGRIPLTDYFKSPFAFLLLIEHKF